MKDPSISIIIPTYNSSKTIKRCINSFIYQLSSIDSILIIDDNSIDNTMDLISDLDFKNLFFYKNPKTGPNSARNFGIEKSKTDYLMFVDSDDYLEEGAIKKIKQNIILSESDILILGYSFTVNSKIVKSSSLSNSKFISSKKNILEIGFTSSYYSSVCWNKVIKATILKKNKNVRLIEDRIHGRDSIFVKELSLIAKNILFLDGVQYISVITTNSFSRSFSLRNVNSSLDCIQKLINLKNKNNIPTEIIFKSITKIMIYIIFYSAIRLNYKSFKKAVFLIYDKLKNFLKNYKFVSEMKDIKNLFNFIIIFLSFKLDFLVFISFRIAKKMKLIVDY
ncbi:MAG: glycosyltransferase family 2 protein [Pelagibacteraceae bacterium TMED124]|nr:MAG: glycosyltransferase family 2 protein [Pelagibacteraceae bacterium TMED124]